MEEVWRPVFGYEGLYSVSNTGKVMSLCWQGNKRKMPKILIPCYTRLNYLYVSLSKDQFAKKHKIHRLVASSFCTNLDNKNIVNHKDGNTENNNSSNLEWCTQSENMQHAYDTGLRKFPKTHPWYRIPFSTIKDVRNMYKENPHMLYKNIARELGLPYGTVYYIIKKELGKHVKHKE